MRKMDEYLVKLDTIYPDGYNRETLFRSSGDMLEAAPVVTHGNRLARLFRAIALWQHRRRSRLVLRDLSQEQLRDIGLSRVEADTEARKPPYVGRLSSF
ncbi:MAG: DUF1127 domain-containing protein [Allorhizobium sp.]